MLNWLRTILGGGAGVILANIMVDIFKCTGTGVGDATCAAAFIPLQYQAMAGFAFIVLNLVLKGFAGTGTVVQNLVAPVAPIVPEAVAGPGTVTLKQVQAK